MAVEWERLATEGMLKSSTLHIPMYLSQKNPGAIQSSGLNLFRPFAMGGNVNVPVLHFSSTDAEEAGSDDNDIKDYWAGEATAGDDYSTAYFDLVTGSMAGYVADADNLVEDVMGCAFMIPQGDSSVAKHEFDISLLMSQEQDADSQNSNATIHVTLWKADVGETISMNGTNDTIRFRLVKKTLLKPSGSTIQLPTLANTMIHQTTQAFDVPLTYNTSSNWSNRMCYYILGCWVQGSTGTSNLLTPQTSAQMWPEFNGSGKGSIKAFVNVTYQRIVPS